MKNVILALTLTAMTSPAWARTVELAKGQSLVYCTVDHMDKGNLVDGQAEINDALLGEKAISTGGARGVSYTIRPPFAVSSLSATPSSAGELTNGIAYCALLTKQ